MNFTHRQLTILVSALETQASNIQDDINHYEANPEQGLFNHCKEELVEVQELLNFINQ